MEKENYENLKLIMQVNINKLDAYLEEKIIEILKDQNFNVTKENQEEVILKAKEIYFAG